MPTERPVREEHTSTTPNDTVHGGSDRGEPSGKLLIVCQEAGGGILAVLPFGFIVALIHYENNMGLETAFAVFGLTIVGTILKIVGTRNGSQNPGNNE